MSTPTSAQQQQPVMTNGDAAVLVNNSNYPLRDVANPHPHDVLCGRGGATNSHIGNSHWRTLVTTNKELYVTLPKRQKQLLSKSIVHAVRSQNPPGRFLQKDFGTGLWFDVGDVRAQEKTSQALREGAPQLRVKLQKSDGEAEAESAASPVVPAAAAPSPSINCNNSNKHHHPVLPAVPPPVAAQGPVVDQRKNYSNPPPSAAIHKHATSCADNDGDVVPPPPSTLDPTGELSLGTITIPDPSEMGGLENGFSFGSVMSGVEESSRYCASSNTASCSNDTVQIIGGPSPPQYHQQQQQQHSSRPVQRDSLADAGGRLMPPTALQANELSFGSIIMTDAEQSRLETNMQQQQQYNSSYAQPLYSSSQRDVTSSNYTRFGRPISSRAVGDDVMVQPVDRGLEPAGQSAGSMMSIGTINTNLENAGMSLGSMISPVDGGLEAIGTSFGSMTIGGPNNTSSHNTLPAMAETPPLPLPSLPPPPQPPVPMEAVPTFLRQKRSKGDLLECSDTESEDEEHSAQASAAQKSAEWEKLKATFEAQMAGGAYNSATVPPSFNPIATSAIRAQQRAATAPTATTTTFGQQQQPLVLDIPETGFGRDLSQMSACSVGEYQDEHHNPAENNLISLAAAPLIGGRQQQGNGGTEMPRLPPTPLPPPQGSMMRTESEELRALEVTLLNRGSSLAAEDFHVPRQPE